MFDPLSFAVVALGASAFVTQVVLLRELLAATAGNELVLGIVLGNWFLLMGLGAALGRVVRAPGEGIGPLVAGQVLVAVLPPGAVFLVRAARDAVFARGVEIGPPETVLATLVLLAPYCLLMGWLLTLATHLVGQRRGVESVGRVYYLDSLGGIGGGLLFTFVLAWWLDHFQSLLVPLVLNLAAAAWVAWSARRRTLAAAAAVVLASVAAAMLVVDLDTWSTRLTHPGREIVFRGSSPYGDLVVTQARGQYTFVENGKILFATENAAQVESAVHFAMAQRPEARRVLLVGGGASGTARELLKYPQAVIDYVELDPLVIRVARQILPELLSDSRIQVILTDARLWLRTAGRRYDVVIVDMPDPSTSQLNRFYTREFFASVHAALQSGGVLGFSLGEYEDYVGPDLGRMLATARATLAAVFDSVLVLPGARVRFLASDGPLTADVAGRLEALGIPTRVMNRHYLRGDLTPERLAGVRRAAAEPAEVNRDFSPILTHHHLRYWMSQFKVRFGLLEAALLVALAAYLARIRPVALAVFTSGFAASVLQVVLLLGFQILYGSLYHRVGLVVAMFMLGLAAGALVMNRCLARCGRATLAGLLLATAIFAAALPWTLAGLAGFWWIGQAIIPGLALLLAMLVGMQFPLAGKLQYEPAGTTAARLYTADYLGAALGALLVSTWLIPLAGVTAACLGTAVACLLVAGVTAMSRGGG